MRDEYKPLTKWEAGNELVKAADALGDCVTELNDHPHIQAKVRKLRKEISVIFNKHGFVKEMGFGL